ncbi:hypothetical protein D3C78_1901850 [compost metagenome]
MRPPLHMPLPAMMMAPLSMRLMAMDSSGLWVTRRGGSHSPMRAVPVPRMYSRSVSENSLECCR